MGFGFNPEEDEEEKNPNAIEHNFYETLKFQDWDKLKLGTNVQSVLTGNSGVITIVNRKYFLIEIDWHNGKHSRASKNDLDKVILI